MDTEVAHQAFDDLVAAAKADGVPREVVLRARPVIDAQHPGKTVKVSNKTMPEGTEPSEPDSLAIEIQVSGAPGTMVGTKVLEIASEHGLSLGSSDALLT